MAQDPEVLQLDPRVLQAILASRRGDPAVQGWPGPYGRLATGTGGNVGGVQTRFGQPGQLPPVGNVEWGLDPNPTVVPQLGMAPPTRVPQPQLVYGEDFPDVRPLQPEMPLPAGEPIEGEFSVIEDVSPGAMPSREAFSAEAPITLAYDEKFNTRLTPDEEAAFNDWKQKYAPNDSGEDYDLRGAFKAGLTPDANGHWPDTFKKPNHPTFSDQSHYAKFGTPGHWEGETFKQQPVGTPPGTAVPWASNLAEQWTQEFGFGPGGTTPTARTTPPVAGSTRPNPFFDKAAGMESALSAGERVEAQRRQQDMSNLLQRFRASAESDAELRKQMLQRSPPGTPYQGPPVVDAKEFQGFISIMSVVSVLLGFASRTPLTAALGNLGAAVNGFYDGQQDKAKRDLQNFKVNYDIAMNAYREDMDKFTKILEDRRLTRQEQLDLLNLEMNARGYALEADHAKFQRLVELGKMWDSRENAIAKLEEAKTKLEQSLLFKEIGLSIREQNLELHRQAMENLQGQRRYSDARQIRNDYQKSIQSLDVAQEIINKIRALLPLRDAAADQEIQNYLGELNRAGRTSNMRYLDFANFGNIGQRVTSAIEHHLSGQRYTDSQRADIEKMMRAMEDDALAPHRDLIANHFTNVAKKYNLDPTEVIVPSYISEAPGPSLEVGKLIQLPDQTWHRVTGINADGSVEYNDAAEAGPR